MFLRGGVLGQTCFGDRRNGGIRLLSPGAARFLGLEVGTMNGLRIGTPVMIDDIELIPIERINVGSDAIPGGLVAFASKEPAAIVVRSRRGDRAVDLEGRDASLDRLLREVPGLREWMQGTTGDV
jgi:uncharacterized spore protein YtfJ